MTHTSFQSKLSPLLIFTDRFFLITAMVNLTIDLFNVHVLFSHFRPRDVTLENSFFQMSSYARAYARITCERQKENSLENITWFEMGKQNV